MSLYNYIISFSRLDVMTNCLSGCLIRLLGEFVKCECMTVIFAIHTEHFQNVNTEAARGRYLELQEYLTFCYLIRLSILFWFFILIPGLKYKIRAFFYFCSFMVWKANNSIIKHTATNTLAPCSSVDTACYCKACGLFTTWDSFAENACSPLNKGNWLWSITTTFCVRI